MEFAILFAAVALPLTFAAIGYKLGQKKGQPVAGLLLGLLLGPIGLVAVALSEPKGAK